MPAISASSALAAVHLAEQLADRPHVDLDGTPPVLGVAEPVGEAVAVAVEDEADDFALRLKVGLPELPPMMSAVETKFSGVSAASR